MPDNDRDESAPGLQPAGSNAFGFAVIIGCAVLPVNFLLILVAAADRSQLAAGIMIIFGPIANGIIALVSLFCIPAKKCRTEGRPIEPYIIGSIGVPLMGAGLTSLAIGTMTLHGC